MNKRLIPILLLKDDALVKGVKYRDYRYLGDPINAIKIFNDKEVDELFFFDILASQENRSISIDTVQKIAEECFMPFGVGGGINTVNQARKILRAGAEKISINTASILNKHVIKEITEEFGSQSLVVSIDVNKNFFGKKLLSYRNSQASKSYDIIEWAKEVESLGAGELLVNSVYNDGLMQGYDIDLISKISESVSIPVIASCGAGSTEHFDTLFSKTEASAAAAGSLFVYHGKHKAVLINYPNYTYKSKIIT